MTFVLETQADLARAIERLTKIDPRLSRIVAATGIPPLRRRPAGLRGLARIIVGQQVSTASAEAIWKRLDAAFPSLTADDILGATDETLGTIGLSAAKTRSLRYIATEIAERRLDLGALGHWPADEAHARLTALRGVGPWTADVYLLFCLGNADAWPAADLGIQEGLKRGLELADRPTTKETIALGDQWRPLRGAAAHVWWAYARIGPISRAHAPSTQA
jgi:DNA-3-methyladenine glycosylase II